LESIKGIISGEFIIANFLQNLSCLLATSVSKQRLMRHVSVGLGWIAVPELSMNDGGRVQLCWKRIPESWSCGVETVATGLSFDPWNKHVVSFWFLKELMIWYVIVYNTKIVSPTRKSWPWRAQFWLLLSVGHVCDACEVGTAVKPIFGRHNAGNKCWRVQVAVYYVITT